jgi:hypothetical protein
MTQEVNLTVTRGDSASWLLSLLTPLAAAFDLTGSVLRATGKCFANDDMDDAVWRKTSYDGGLRIVTAVGGEVLLSLRPRDTVGLSVGTKLIWDLELVEPVASVASTGTVTVGANGLMTFSDAGIIDLIELGMLVVLNGVNVANQITVAVTAESTAFDDTLPANSARTDYTSFVAESAVPFSLLSSEVRTVARGSFTVTYDVTSL